MTQTKLDFTNEFKPIWQKFKWFLAALLLIWLFFVLFVVLGWGLNLQFVKNNWDSLFKYLFILGVPGSWLGWAYFDFALRCPNCKQRFVFWWYPGISPYMRVFLAGECFNCGAILKKKWMSQESAKKLRNILVVIVILILLIGIIASFIKGEIGIKYEHFDIPSQKCQ